MRRIGRELSISTSVFQLLVFDLNRMFDDLLELTKKRNYAHDFLFGFTGAFRWNLEILSVESK